MNKDNYLQKVKNIIIKNYLKEQNVEKTNDITSVNIDHSILKKYKDECINRISLSIRASKETKDLCGLFIDVEKTSRELYERTLCLIENTEKVKNGQLYTSPLYDTINFDNIKKQLRDKLSDYISSIDDKHIRNVLRENIILSGGALVSAINKEKINDYDVYLRTKQSVVDVLSYYIKAKEINAHVDISGDEDRVSMFIGDVGIFENLEKKEDYDIKFISSNAVTLYDDIQIINRFYGEIEELHKNFDFAHCMCAYDYHNDELYVPREAVDCIEKRKIVYKGSKYPICSMVRTRKYIKRGYSINAGQYLKMAIHVNQLNLKDVEVLKEQLCGVDSAYFSSMIEEMKNEKNNNVLDFGYIEEVVCKYFDNEESKEYDDDGGCV